MDSKNALRTIIARLWAAPTPADLWALQAPLLAIDTPEAHTAHAVAGKLHNYLRVLEYKLTAQRYSKLSALLEAGAVTTIGLADVLEGETLSLRELLVAGLAGTLEVVAAMQEVKAWQIDTRAADQKTVWDLYGMLWGLSAQMQPDLSPAERAALLEDVMAPFANADTPDAARVALITRLLQLVLLVYLLLLFAPQLSGDADA